MYVPRSKSMRQRERHLGESLCFASFCSARYTEFSLSYRVQFLRLVQCQFARTVTGPFRSFRHTEQ